MEIVFLLISILITLIFVYLIGRILHTHKGLINAYKRSDSLLFFHFVMGILMVMVLFVTLCAFNNSIWHLPYLK